MTVRPDGDAVARWRALGLHADQTLPDVFEDAARTRGGVWRLFHSDERAPRMITLAEGQALSRDWAARLQGLGVGLGDTVAVQLPYWWEAYILSQAVIMTGARLLPVHPIYHAADLDYVLRESRAKVFIAPDRTRAQDYLPGFEALEGLPDLEHLIVLGERTTGAAVRWSDLMAEAQPRFTAPRLHPDDPCVLIFTSGTTSRPKGVLHSHNTLLAEGRSFAAFRPVDPVNPTVLGAAVFGHIGAVLDLLRGPLLGVNAINRDRWEARACLELITRYKPASTNGTPFHLLTLMDLVDAGEGDISSLNHFSMGATAISPAHVEALERRGIRATRVYGSTEHPTVCSGLVHEPLDTRATTEGRALPGVEVRLLNEDSEPSPPGASGELVTRGPDLCLGYLREEDNRSAWLPGGWFRTGDIARIDEAGRITIVDRKKDIIIRGGENLSSKEIEDALVLYCGAREAAVVAMPDPRYGERVCAFVLRAPGTTLGLDEVRAQFAKAGLAKQKAPERLVLLDEFPRTATGKIRKAELRERVRSEMTTDSASILP